jgi:hypothetical protein
MPAPERSRVVLPFGQGLDRETGVMVVRPASMEDLRNLLLYQGKAQVRRGFLRASDLLASGSFGTLAADEPMTHVLAIQSLRTVRIGIVVAWEEDSREVHVFTVDATGRNPVHVGYWFTAHNGMTFERPVIVTTEARGRVFLAHDEPDGSYPGIRANTMVYDPAAAIPLHELVIDYFNTGTYTPIPSRGVQRHSKYLFLWGYGTPTDPHRPELLRVSYPGLTDPSIPPDPLRQFDPEHYFVVQQRNEPILAAAVAGARGGVAGRLLIFKETEFSYVRGTSWLDFGEDVVDSRYGVANSRLIAETEDGLVFFWSIHGPRYTSGGPSVDLSIPLDLGGPAPATLLAHGDIEQAFAVWNPFDRAILFVFPEGRVYCLSVRSEPWQWSYWELGFRPTSGGLLYNTGVLAGAGPIQPSPGYPDLDQPDTLGGVGVIQVAWDNVGAIGDEIVEIWIKAASASVYTLVDAVQVSGASQVRVVSGTWLVEDEEHAISLRYRRASVIDAAYEDPDPSTWPAISLGTATPTSAGGGPPLAPGNLIVEWYRTSATSELMRLGWSPKDPLAETEIWADVNGAGYVLLDTVAAGVSLYDDVDPGGEIEILYKVRHIRATETSAFSNEVTSWVGPEAPDAEFHSPEPEHIAMFGVALPPAWTWRNAAGQLVSPTLEAELWLDIGIIPEGSDAVDGNFNFAVEVDEGTPGTYNCLARVVATSYGSVVDEGRFTAIVPVEA